MRFLSDGIYATSFYLPLSRGVRRWRQWHRWLRGKTSRHQQPTTLPTISWREVTRTDRVSLVSRAKANGNVTLPELAIISGMARTCESGDVLFEIGTFDGRTTLHLALHSENSCPVVTLDLPPELEPVFNLEAGEEHMVDKPESGWVFRDYRHKKPDAVDRIQQLYGDSADFDFSRWHGACGLVFIDASHQYDYVITDSASAMALVRPGGLVLWHDYGVWPGVTRALEELAGQQSLALRHIRGTSLVCWRKPSA